MIAGEILLAHGLEQGLHRARETRHQFFGLVGLEHDPVQTGLTDFHVLRAVVTVEVFRRVESDTGLAAVRA